MTAAEIRQRARTAREYLAVAQERIAKAPEGPSGGAQVAAANAVFAAIAAVDALCGQAHGHHATGQDHREATKLLRAVPDVGPKLAPKFARLVAEKSGYTYGGFCTRVVAVRAAKDAKALVGQLDVLSL